MDKLPEDLVKFTLRNLKIERKNLDGFLVFGNAGVGNEEHGVGALLFSKALGKATNLFGIGGLPEWSFTTLTQFLVLCNSASIRVDGIA